MRPIVKIVLTFLFLLAVGTLLAEPATYIVTGNNVNLRSGPGTQYEKIGKLQKGDTIVILALYNQQWAQFQRGKQTGYINRKYITYKAPGPKPIPPKKHADFWDSLYKITEAILWICAAIIVIGYLTGSSVGGLSLLLQIICGIGAIIGWGVFNDSKAGAVVGMAVGLSIYFVLFILPLFEEGFHFQYGRLTYSVWYVISLPFYILNLLQFWLAKPWRPFMKKNTLSDSSKKTMRIFLQVMKVPFYFLLFPLRFLNACYYNLLLRNLYEWSNYLLEVFIPSDEKEGAKHLGSWLVYLPVRVGKYLILHGTLTLVETIIWTVIDTFVPAITLYHGTQKDCADSILCEPKRNQKRKNTSGWFSGIWNVGGGNYAGDGIYFGIFRKTLRNYQTGAAIVARVTMGKTIDTILMPDKVYNQAGYPNAKAVSDWALRNGFVSGEWWRSDRSTNWWEICMFDRKNKYNDSWRIRPIYVIDSDSGIMQRVSGGTAHWLFRKMVWQDFRNFIK